MSDDFPRWLGGLFSGFLALVALGALIVGCGFWIAPLIQEVRW